jgi:hypothetical protein
MKKILIIGDKDPIDKWLPFAEEFVKLGYYVTLYFYYRNKRKSEEYNISKNISVTIIRSYKNDPVEIHAGEAEKILGIDSLSAFLFTECRLYNRTFKKVSIELLWLLDILQNKITFTDFDFILQNQGAGILRRLIFNLSKQKGVENIYFNVNWFPGRSFYQRNEMNILDNYSVVPFASVSEELKAYLVQFMKTKTLSRQSYKYKFNKKQSKKAVSVIFRKLSEKSILKSIGFRLKRIPKVFKSLLITLIFDKINTTKLPDNIDYFFFPLHYPKDSQMTLRNHPYMRQYSLVEYIGWNLPSDTVLIVKPHPQAKADYSFHELNTIRKTQNVILIKPSISSHKILSKTNFRGLITLNSSVGFECLCYKKPVITLSDFYGITYPGVIVKANLSDIARVLNEILEKENNTEEEYIAALASIYTATLPGEFYTSQIDYTKVCSSIIERLNKA